MNSDNGYIFQQKQRILHFIQMAIIVCIADFSSSANAQEIPNDNNVYNAFRNSININTPTTTFIKPYGFEFQIRHRFGALQMDESIISDFLGMDLTANIQFAFSSPINNKTTIGASRTKTGKTYDLFLKRLIIRQTSDNSVPVTVAVYGDASVNSSEFGKVPPFSYFDDGITPFENKFNHRLTYNSQIMVSRKFGEILSLQLSGVCIYRNLVPTGEENLTYAIPLSGSIKITDYSSFIFEYAYLMEYEPANNIYPLSIGYEFGTVGHVFQIILSSSSALLESNLYTSEQYDYTKGEFLLGFNIKRFFWNKKKIKRLTLEGKL